MNWPHLCNALLAMLVFGLLGIVLLLIGYKLFDAITPGLNFQKELGEKHNIAVAILVAAFILGISAIIVASILG
jgi:putative membrane protein